MSLMKPMFALLSMVCAAALMAEDVRLPAPRTTGGMPLMEALAKRATSRRTAGEAPTPQQLSDLLWAANGITRKDATGGDGKRTAPSAMDKREIQIAVLTEKGLFTWDPVANTLTETPACVDLEDQRRGASVFLVFFYDKAVQSRDAALADVGFVGQNVYLFCTSQGWNSVFMGSIDRAKLATALGREKDEILFAQRIGVK